MAVFAGALTFATVFVIPENGGVPCYYHCDSVRTILSIAFAFFVTSLVWTIFVPLVLRKEKLHQPPVSKARRQLSQAAILITVMGLVGGFTLLGVVLLLSDQKAAGGLIITSVAICCTTQLLYWLLDRFTNLYSRSCDDANQS